MQQLLDRGIATRRGIMLSHQEPPYVDSAAALPRSEQASARSLLLPLFPQMEEQEQDAVIMHVVGVARRPVRCLRS